MRCSRTRRAREPEWNRNGGEFETTSRGRSTPSACVGPDMSPDRAIEATQRGLRASRGFLVVHSGLISLVFVLAFVTACVALQWLRTDLDWRLAPMSSYLKGPYGGWLRLAYYGLGAGLALLGQGLFHAVQPARNRLPTRLLALGGIALVITAITETDLPYLVRSQELL